MFLQDVKEEKPVVKILDFGLAKRSRGGHVLTLEGQLLGTPLYMSPEQCRGKDVDHRTDIYALGCIWYQLLTGRPPFDVSTVAELVMAHVSQTPRPPRELASDIPLRVDALVGAMLAKDPQQRPTLAGVRSSKACLACRRRPCQPSSAKSSSRRFQRETERGRRKNGRRMTASR